MDNSNIILPKEISDLVSDWFWDIIWNANQNADRLREILREMDQESIVKFQEQFLDAAGELQIQPFLNYMEESEDGIEEVIRVSADDFKNNLLYECSQLE
ncbi:hypothetical protein [Lysinibacillus sp. NPDC056185]|uniref:hypothetical protein n=1 Tax=Lysinibacillus sp. NPDC056185 TaxID=3345739 RepID=UPI0039EF1F7D